jgi:hypothetical protein
VCWVQRISAPDKSFSQQSAPRRENDEGST